MKCDRYSKKLQGFSEICHEGTVEMAYFCWPVREFPLQQANGILSLDLELLREKSSVASKSLEYLHVLFNMIVLINKQQSN